MATSTQTNQFVKPDYADPADIAVLNNNWDSIDLNMVGPSDGVPYELSGEVATHNGQKRGIHGIKDTNRIVYADQLGWDPYNRIVPFSRYGRTSQTVVDSTLYLTYARPQVDVLASKFFISSTATAASGATLATLAAFKLETDGSLTQVATTGDLHTTLLIAANTAYEPAFASSATYLFRSGITYVFATLLVGSGATVQGTTTGVETWTPILSQQVAAQTTMPTTIAAGSLAASSIALWVGVKE